MIKMPTYRITPQYKEKVGYSSKMGFQYNHIPVVAANINSLRKKLIKEYLGKAAFIQVSYDKNRKEIGELWLEYDIRWKTTDYIPNYGQAWTFYAVKKDGSLGRIIKKM